MSILRRTKRDGPSNDEGRSKSMRAVYHARLLHLLPTSIRQDVSWNLRGASWVCSVPLQLLVHCHDPKDDRDRRKRKKLAVKTID